MFVVPKPPNPELAVLVPPKANAGLAAVLAPNKPPPVGAAAPKPPKPRIEHISKKHTKISDLRSVCFFLNLERGIHTL